MSSDCWVKKGPDISGSGQKARPAEPSATHLYLRMCIFGPRETNRVHPNLRPRATPLSHEMGYFASFFIDGNAAVLEILDFLQPNLWHRT